MKIVQKKGKIDFFDDVFDNVLKSPIYALSNKIVKMQTDVREFENSYVLDIDLAGFKKEEINISVEDGYLRVEANKTQLIEEEKNYLRRERLCESCNRYYYIGNIKLDEIKASYQDGILQITVPKEQELQDTKKYISIE